MIGMTGFAYREWAGEDISVSVEVKGYNSRYLEIYVNSPPWLSRLEPKIREHVTGVCGRGKVEVLLRVRELNTPLKVSVNANAAGAYLQAVSDLAKSQGIDEKLSVSVLIGLEGVLEIEKPRDEQRYWTVIEPVLRDAIGAFQEERAREGRHAQENILGSIGRVESALQTVESRVPDIENTIKENITSRFRELTGSGIDENRVLAETAILLMKYTISEEVSRLSSHLAEFRAETARNERPGKKLDFLCQEINREINTIGSKSPILEVSRAVVEMKESVENAREQLRNVE
ncbi:MAG: YicC family protein [Treponema sp.]|jgi:uncharacterized protein (TIGR00255 family)|nr:YicC family protein [Treponema sp.]